jgi:hypothetical protein
MDLPPAQVRQKVLEKLGNVITSVGADTVSSLVLPVVAALVSDPQWRVREQVIEQLPLLAQHLGAPVFEERLLALYLSSYHDQVCASPCRVLRDSATHTLLLLLLFGCCFWGALCEHVCARQVPTRA